MSMQAAAKSKSLNMELVAAHMFLKFLQECVRRRCAALVRAVRGQGVILSSGARAAFELRGPYDAVNLATLLGLRGDQAQACHSPMARYMHRPRPRRRGAWCPSIK